MEVGAVQNIDIQIAEGISQGNKLAFEMLYKYYYKKLCSYSYSIVKDMSVAEEIVQNFIYKLWESRKTIDAPDRLRFYLFRAIYNNSLQYKLSNKRFDEFEALEENHSVTDQTIQQNIETEELKTAISDAINKMPKQTREIFTLSRKQNYTYKEIANHTNLSVKSVEYHISKAMRFMERELKGFLSILLFVLYKLF